MPTVRLSGPNNSTLFTTCCDVAITDREECCPKCKAVIWPRSRDARWEAAYGPWRRREVLR